MSESELPGRHQVEKSKLRREIGAGDPPGKVKREWRTEP